METTRVIQSAAVVLCLVLGLSGMCYSYPFSYYSSDEENLEHGVRDMLNEWEREGLIRSLLPNPNKAYLTNENINNNNVGGGINGHEIYMTRKAPRSGSNSNLRLRYGKRSSLPQPHYEMLAMGGAAEDPRISPTGNSNSADDANGKSGNWKLLIPGRQ